MATTVGDIIFLGDPPHEMPMTQSAATRVADGYVELLLDLDTSQDGSRSVQVRTRLPKMVAMQLGDDLGRTLEDLI